MVVAHAFNLDTREEEAGRALELEASLVYRAGCRTDRATQRSRVLKKYFIKERSLTVIDLALF